MPHNNKVVVEYARYKDLKTLVDGGRVRLLAEIGPSRTMTTALFRALLQSRSRLTPFFQPDHVARSSVRELRPPEAYSPDWVMAPSFCGLLLDGCRRAMVDAPERPQVLFMSFGR